MGSVSLENLADTVATAMAETKTPSLYHLFKVYKLTWAKQRHRQAVPVFRGRVTENLCFLSYSDFKFSFP